MSSKILVVDDEINMLKLLCDLLKEDDGYEVETASSGEEALEKIKKVIFDLIISDIKMPGMNGLELLEKIKTMDINAAVIFITGYGSVDSAVEAMKLGASDYIEKPFDILHFKNLVSQVLNERIILNDIRDDKLLVYTLSRAIFEK
jgi:two-component system response regulator PilR (NtrC family)